jgi:hypothetical protein
MRVLNLPTILKEYLILWALGTLFGVTQDVDMVTTRANSFGQYAVAVLEPEAITIRIKALHDGLLWLQTVKNASRLTYHDERKNRHASHITHSLNRIEPS